MSIGMQLSGDYRLDLANLQWALDKVLSMNDEDNRIPTGVPSTPGDECGPVAPSNFVLVPVNYPSAAQPFKVFTITHNLGRVPLIVLPMSNGGNLGGSYIPVPHHLMPVSQNFWTSTSALLFLVDDPPPPDRASSTVVLVA